MNSTKKREFKPTFYLVLISVTILVCLMVFHLSNVTIKPRLSPPISRQIFSVTNGPKPFITECTPKTNLFFLKTHKTASTTVQNILLRYAESHNLTIALPILSDTHLFPLDRPFNRKMVKESPWGSNGFNIMCHHLVYNRPEIEAVMPADTLFFTIIRDPVTLFESHYEYNNWREKFGLKLDQFASLTKKKRGRKYSMINQGKYQNLLLKDFGLEITQNDNNNYQKKVFSLIADVDKKFKLVMLTEFFDESIVLLNRTLCWETRDLVSFTNNARSDKYRNRISEKTASALRLWNKADQLMYTFFRKKFLTKLKKAWRSFNVTEKVEELRLKREEMRSFCIDTTASPKDLKEFKFWTNKVVGYKLKSRTSTCENLVKPERQFTNELRMKQLFRSLPPNIAPQFMSKMVKNKDGETNFVKRDLDVVNLIFLANNSGKKS